MSRLAAGIWVQAYLMRLQIDGIYAHVIHRGDATAGAVWVKLATMNGQAALWERSYDLMGDTREWACTMEGPEPEIDARIARERGRDRDLWVLEVEDPRGRNLLDDPSLA